MPAELTRDQCAVAAKENRLGALVLAAPAVESELSGLHYAFATSLIDNALGHAHRAEYWRRVRK